MLQEHQDFVMILVLAVVFRFTAILVLRPGGYLGDISDFGYYRLLLSFVPQGFMPLVDFWVEYPPVFPWLLVGLYRLSLLIPAWSEPGSVFFLLLSSFLAVVEAGNLVLFYAIGRRLFDRERAVQLCWIYVVLLVPLLTLFVVFDGLVLLFLLWGVLLTLDRRPIGSGIAIGLGFMTKLVPVVAAPAALQHLKPWSRRIQFLAAAALTIVLIALPFLVTAPDTFVQAFRGPMARTSWETVWALIDGYYSYGVAGGWDRFEPSQAGAAQHVTRLPWPVITIGFVLLFLALYTRRIEWDKGRMVVAFTALTQNLLLLYNQGYSPQFLIMLLPFVILLLPRWRGIAYALLLSVINLVEFPVYFVVLPEAHWLLAGTVLLRTLIVIVLSVEYAAQVYEWRIPQRWWQRIAAGITALVVILGLIAAVAGFRTYSQARYEASSHRPAMDLLAQQAAPGAYVITDDQGTYEQLYPFLRDSFKVILIETHDYLPPWEPRLEAAVAQASGQLWIYAPNDTALHRWLAERYEPIAQYDLDGWQLSGWDTQ